MASVERVLRTTRDQQIREAAEACLPYLQARAAMGKHTLLRAVSEEGGELLRAAHGSEGDEYHALLRPVSIGAESTTDLEPKKVLASMVERTEETQ